MTDHNSIVLWNSIEDFEIGFPDASLSFADRLARENGWGQDFAERVIQEYRRFCFLAMTAGHPVTPSEEVDQAWHLHLLYTENYWTDFCGKVLRRPLHHGPTRGGRREGEKYSDWYQATLESYAQAFGEEPPVDIWPGVQARFQNAHRFRRINTASHWVIRKPNGGFRPWLVLVLTLPILGACATAGDARSLFLPAIGAIVIALVLFGYLSDRSRARRRRKGGKNDSAGATGGSSGWRWGGGDQSGCGSSGCGGGGCGGGGCGS